MKTEWFAEIRTENGSTHCLMFRSAEPYPEALRRARLEAWRIRVTLLQLWSMDEAATARIAPLDEEKAETH